VKRLRGLAPWETALLAAAAVWTFLPLAALVADAARKGRTLTGGDGPIPGDQLQYLAWVRDVRATGLASNLFDLRAGEQVFAHPMFTLSGWANGVGVPIQLAYWAWKPIAVVVLVGGAVIWVRRMLPGRPGAQAAAATLALFAYSPLSALVLWGDLGSSPQRKDVATAAGELFAAGELWGYAQTAIAIGLMPAVILLTERATRPLGPSGGVSTRALVAAAALLGLLVSWLHPWQGVALAFVLAGLAAWPGQPPRRRLAAVLPIVGLALPLAYYEGLSRFDAAWELAAAQNEVGRLDLWTVLLAVVPLAIPAAFGLRRPGGDVAERALLLWIGAALLSYALVSAFPPHALAGASFPLAVLAVRGFQRLRAPVPVAVAALAVLALPGIAYQAREMSRAHSSPIQQLYLRGDEADALAFLRRDAPPGGVLAPVAIATSIPSQTGRPVWVGHPSWTPDYDRRRVAAEELFEGRLDPALARSLVRATGARLLVADCRGRADLRPLLGPLVMSTRRFGCATVYEVAA
jgi:hypothetical protein